MQALGLIETRGLLAAVESADAMLKAAQITLLDKTYVGGGLVSIAVTGDVGAVKAAVEAGAAAVKQLDDALLVSQHVIPRPHEEVDHLIVPRKLQKDMEVQNTELAEAKTADKVEVSETVFKETMIDEAISEENEAEEPIGLEAASDEITENEVKSDEITTEETIADDITTEETEADDTTIKIPDFNPDKIHKEIIDKIVQDFGYEKAIEILNSLKVTKLRNLAREYKNLKIAGRKISKADKKILLSEFKEYYK